MVWTHDEDGHLKIPTTVLPMYTDMKKAKGEIQEKMEGWNQKSNRNKRRGWGR